MSCQSREPQGQLLNCLNNLNKQSINSFRYSGLSLPQADFLSGKVLLTAQHIAEARTAALECDHSRRFLADRTSKHNTTVHEQHVTCIQSTTGSSGSHNRRHDQPCLNRRLTTQQLLQCAQGVSQVPSCCFCWQLVISHN
jgi:hypothetical protein